MYHPYPWSYPHSSSEAQCHRPGFRTLGRPISGLYVLRVGIPTQVWPGVQGQTWWLDPAHAPGGGWIDHAIYQVDFLRWLLDDEVVRVTGVAKTLVHAGELPKELEDFGVALIEFRKGAVATVEVTWAAPGRGGLSQTQRRKLSAAVESLLEREEVATAYRELQEDLK